MQKISGEKFRTLLYSDDGDDLITDYEVEIENQLVIDLENVFVKTYFSNIKFTGKLLKFYKKDNEQIHLLDFNNCMFSCNLNFDNCNLNDLIFDSSNFQDKLIFGNSKILKLSFKGNNVFEKESLEIDNCEFTSNFDIEKIVFNSFSGLMIKNTDFKCSVSVVDCVINKLIISNCFFKDHFDFFRNKSNFATNSYFFNRCEFNYSSFFKTIFNNDTHFADCKFLNITKIENTGDEIKTTLRFDDCEFLNQVSFNKSRIYKILFNNIKFNDIVSLQETYFDIVDIDRTIFEKQANFDDIQIKQIYNCNRRTIRTIKLQLQKAENKIDYNKFRVYEFNAYREDIKKRLKDFEKDKGNLNHRVREPKQLKRDAFVLWISDLVSEYGTDWKRALKFTLLCGSLIYLLFYSTENYNHKIDLLNWNNWTHFISGLFRFFLVTDFYNPLESERVYLTNPLSWLLFIFGKIVIAFGIYEMIQSFRKFKA